VPQNAFRKGFLAGWSSIRGSEPAPTIPACTVEPGKDPYRAGVARGVQDQANQATKGTVTPEAWIDEALRRPRRPTSS
jgi:hypothetical protein